MKFVDSTEIKVQSGDGGGGVCSFRTARNKPKLGPDGGNGGNGGNVYLVTNPGLNTLSSLRYRQAYKAEHGGRGSSNVKTGKCGLDKEVQVPCGTIATDINTGEVLGELMEPDSRLLVAKGGKRGYGNYHHLKATHQAPTEFSIGEPGIEIDLQLELKLIADVGLAGFPNAGKSTLLSRISAARPKIADYPFTTLVPNLGVVDLGELGGYDESFVVADIPGLIEGASDGKGLGHEFLRHLERTRMILYVVDGFCVEGRSPVEAATMLRKELSNYSDKLASKRTLVLINKADLADEEFDFDSLLDPIKKLGFEAMLISAVQGKGLADLKSLVYRILEEEKKSGQKRQDELEFISSWRPEELNPTSIQ